MRHTQGNDRTSANQSVQSERARVGCPSARRPGVSISQMRPSSEDASGASLFLCRTRSIVSSSANDAARISRRGVNNSYCARISGRRGRQRVPASARRVPPIARVNIRRVMRAPCCSDSPLPVPSADTLCHFSVSPQLSKAEELVSALRDGHAVLRRPRVIALFLNHRTSVSRSSRSCKRRGELKRRSRKRVQYLF